MDFSDGYDNDDDEDEDSGDVWKKGITEEDYLERYERYAQKVRIDLARIRARYRAEERIPQDGFLEMDLSTFIAACHDFSNSLENEEDRLRVRGKAGVLAYIRDKFNARTYNEAQQAIKNRRIEPEVVKLWLEEAIVGKPEIESIKHGYPEFIKLTETYRWVNSVY